MADVVVIPQSRSEEILAATINGEEYNQPPQSRIEWLLLALKDAIEQGGGGGGTTNYNALSNKPLINSVTLTGDKSLADLGIMTEINKVMAMISGTFDETVGYSKDDVVIYDEKLYKFNTDHAVGAWDSTEVDQVTITDLLFQSSGSVGGISLKKIWENPDPTDGFSPSDVTIQSVANYNKFIMFYQQYKDSANVCSSIFLKDYPTDLMWVFGGGGGVTVRRRDISIIDDTTLHIGNCKAATGTSAQANENNANIPLVLYAIDEQTATSGSSVEHFPVASTDWTANAGTDATDFPYVANITTDLYTSNFVPSEVLLLGADATDYPTAADETAIGLVDKYVKFTGTSIRLRATSAPATNLNLVVRG